MPDEESVRDLIEKGFNEKQVRKKLSISKTKLKEIVKKLDVSYKEKEKKQIKITLPRKFDIFLVFVVLFSVFLFRSFISLRYPPYSDDLGHMMRAFNLKQILSGFELPLWNNFVSSPTLLYRYPAYCLSLVFLMLFLPESLSINLMFLFSQILTAAGIYLLINEISEHKSRLVSSLCSLFAVCNYFNIAWLGAWGGFYPMAFGISLIPLAGVLIIKSKSISQALKYSPFFCIAVLSHPIVSFLSVPFLLVVAFRKNKLKNAVYFIISGLLLSFFWILPSFYEINTVFSTYLKEYPVLQEPLSFDFIPQAFFDIGNAFLFLEWFNVFTFALVLICIFYLLSIKKSFLEIVLFFILIPIIINLFNINSFLVKLPGYNLIVQAWRPIYICIFLSCILIYDALMYANAYMKKKRIFNAVFLVLFSFSIASNFSFSEQISYFFWEMPGPWTESFNLIKNDNSGYFRVVSDVNSPAWISSVKAQKPILSDTQTFFTPLIKESSRTIFNNSFLSHPNWRTLLDLFAIKYVFIDKGFHYGYARSINLTSLSYLDSSKTYKSAVSFSRMFFYQHLFSGVESSVYINNNNLNRAFFVPKSAGISGTPECIANSFASFVLDNGLNIDTWFYYNETGIDCSKLSSFNVSTFEQIPVQTLEKTQSIGVTLNAPSDGYIVLKEFYHPLWQAYVNGKKADVLRALPDYLSVKISEGQNNIRFVFNPFSSPVRIVGLLVSIFCILCISYCIAVKK